MAGEIVNVKLLQAIQFTGTDTYICVKYPNDRIKYCMQVGTNKIIICCL